MITNKPFETSNSLADQLAASASRTMPSTPRVANEAAASLPASAPDLRGQAAPMFDRAGDRLGALAQRSVDAVRDGSQQLHDKALRASDRAVDYVRDEPVKAMLIAAAAGAALFALLGLVVRSRRP